MKRRSAVHVAPVVYRLAQREVNGIPSERNERLEAPEGLARAATLVIDPRLASIWQFLWERDETGASGELLATVLRLAYVQGYEDANEEDEAGGLYRALGLRRELRREPLEGRRSPRAPTMPGNSGT